MAKVAFVQFLYMHILGPMYLSANLKNNGHSCIMVIGSQRDILRKLNRVKPDIVAFSSTANERKWGMYMAKQIKDKFGDKTPIIFGGPLATFSTEIIDNPFVDMICRGEGESAMLELADAFELQTDKTKIRNLWIKQDKSLIKNELRPLASNLDEIMFPDRDLYSDYPFIHDDPSSRVIVTRGCPYSCSFCFEPAYRQLYQEAGYQIRKRTVNNIIEELLILKAKYNKRHIWFIDDLFPLEDKQWLGEFLERYSREVAIPFSCHTRIDLIDEETAEILKNSKFCSGISFGIETGNEEYRKNILKKKIDNEQIKKGVAILKRYKLDFSTTNMIGLPGETIEDALSTIKLNREIGAHFSVCTVYQPLPETELTRFSLKYKYIEENDLTRLALFSHEKSLLKQKDIREIVNLHKFFYVILYLPWLSQLVNFLIKLPCYIFYNMLYKTSYFLFYMNKIHNFKLVRFLKEGIIGFRYYRDKW